MRHSARTLVARAVALALVAFMLAQSQALAAGSQSTEELQEVVVTAQFREQRLQDTPIAITAVNAEMLEARGQTNIADVAAQASNVSLRPQPQNGGSGLIAFIRGVGQVDFNYAVDPGVGLYVDDVCIPTLSSSLLELIDLERIEVLRGPQGTLAGKTLTNARVSYARNDDWKLALEVQNLFNKYYFLSKSDVSAGQLGVVTGVPGLPRTWAVSVERRF